MRQLVYHLFQFWGNLDFHLPVRFMAVIDDLSVAVLTFPEMYCIYQGYVDAINVIFP